ncbi:MAG: LapA family protein, partial [bacterium]
MTDAKAPQKKAGFPLRAVIAGIIAVIALIVIIQNSQSVTIQLFVWSLTLPLWLVLAVFFVLGML